MNRGMGGDVGVRWCRSQSSVNGGMGGDVGVR